MPLCHYAECHCAEFLDLFIGMLNVSMMGVIMQNVVMLGVVRQNVVMLSVVAPSARFKLYDLLKSGVAMTSFQPYPSH